MPGVEVSVEVEAEGKKAQVIDESELGEPPENERKCRKYMYTGLITCCVAARPAKAKS